MVELMNIYIAKQRFKIVLLKSMCNTHLFATSYWKKNIVYEIFNWENTTD